MNENMFQNLIFLGIMSEALAKRNCIKMKLTPTTNEFGLVESVRIKLYSCEANKEEFIFSSAELSRLTWKSLKNMLLPVISLMELSV
jgi:hypothetical protein